MYFRQHDSGGLSDFQDFPPDRLDDTPGSCILCDPPVSRSTERGNRVERTVPYQFRPEFAFNVVRNAAGNTRSLKDRSHPLLFVQEGAAPEISTCDVLD